MAAETPELHKRLVTAALLITVLVILGFLSLHFCTFKWIFLDLAALVSLLSVWEYARFSQRDGGSRSAFWGTFAAFSLPSILMLVSLSSQDLCLMIWNRQVVLVTAGFGIVATTGILLGLLLFDRSRSIPERSARAGEFAAAGYLFIWCAPFLQAIVSLPDSFWSITWLIAVVALNDTAAYFIGSRLGGPALAPGISPKKTISGSIAGLVAGIGAGMALASLLPEASSYLLAGAIAAAVVVAAQLTDLLESFLKRLSGVKDSGTLLPGHGGMLDRIDAILGGAPVLYLALMASGAIG